MVYEIRSTPLDTAELLKSLHAAPDLATRNKMIQESPLPRGCSISLKREKSDLHDQDRICLPRLLALEMDRVWGVIVAIKPETFSANSFSPACAQVLLKIPFWDDDAHSYRSFFARTSAYFANFAPRCPDNMAWTLSRGDVVSGILQRLFYTLCRTQIDTN